MQLIFLTQKRTADFQGTLWVTGSDIWDFARGVTSAPQGLPIRANVNTALCNVGNLLFQRIRNKSVQYASPTRLDCSRKSCARRRALSLHALFLLIEIVDGGSGSSPGGGGPLSLAIFMEIHFTAAHSQGIIPNPGNYLLSYLIRSGDEPENASGEMRREYLRAYPPSSP